MQILREFKRNRWNALVLSTGVLFSGYDNEQRLPVFNVLILIKGNATPHVGMSSSMLILYSLQASSKDHLKKTAAYVLRDEKRRRNYFEFHGLNLHIFFWNYILLTVAMLPSVQRVYFMVFLLIIKGQVHQVMKRRWFNSLGN